MPFVHNVQRLPTTQEEISISWLSSILAQKVKSFDVTSTIMNQSAAKVFLTVTYEDEADIPRPTYICLKGSFNPAMMALEGYSDILLSMYTREVNFFNIVAPNLTNTRLPKVWAAEASVIPPQGILVMDDLNVQGYTFGHPTVPWTFKRILAGAEQLAALHASTWNISPKSLPGFTPAYEDVMIGLTAMWNDVVLGADRPPVPDVVKNQERTVAALKKHFATKNPKFICFLHGDPHPGNTFIDKDDEPGFLDWQTAHIGSAFHDLTYFVIGSMSIDERRTHEMSILAYYLEALAKHGGPSFSIEDEEVSREYKKSMMSGMGWVLTPYAMHRKESVVAMVERYCAAFLDHAVFELVESLPDP